MCFNMVAQLLGHAVHVVKERIAYCSNSIANHQLLVNRTVSTSQGRPLPADFTDRVTAAMFIPDSARLTICCAPSGPRCRARKTKNPGVFSSRVLIDLVLQFDLPGPPMITILNRTEGGS